jgi:DNA-binding transcriptional ArsR family regulator
MAQRPLQPSHCARMLGALAAPERLRIIRALCKGARNVGELADEVKVALNNASHHLAILRRAGLIQGRKQGRFVLYSLASGFFQADGSTVYLDLGCCRLGFPAEETNRRPGRRSTA